jgi:hypothetical protein
MSGSARESTFDTPRCMIRSCFAKVSEESMGFCDKHLEDLRHRIVDGNSDEDSSSTNV